MWSLSWWRFHPLVCKCDKLCLNTILHSSSFSLVWIDGNQIEIKIGSRECYESLYWVWLSKKSKCTHLKFLRNQTLSPFPRKAAGKPEQGILPEPTQICRNALKEKQNKWRQLLDSSVISKKLNFRWCTLKNWITYFQKFVPSQTKRFGREKSLSLW